MRNSHFHSSSSERSPSSPSRSDFASIKGPALAVVSDVPAQPDISPFESKQHYRPEMTLEVGHPVHGLRVASDNRIVCFSGQQVTILDREGGGHWKASELPFSDGPRQIDCAEPLSDGRIAVAMHGDGVATLSVWQQRADGWWVGTPIAAHSAEELIPLKSGAILSRARELRIYRQKNGTQWSSGPAGVPPDTGALDNLRVTPEGMLIGAGSRDGMLGKTRVVIVRENHSEEGRQLSIRPRLGAPDAHTTDLAALSLDRFLTGTSDGAIELWKNEKGRWSRQTISTASTEVSSTPSYIRQIEPADESSFWFTCGSSVISHVQESQPGKWVTKHVLESTGPTNRGTCLPDGRFVVPTQNHTLDIYGLQDGEAALLESPLAHSGYVNAVVLLGAGRLVSGSSDGTLVIWDGASRR